MDVWSLVMPLIGADVWAARGPGLVDAANRVVAAQAELAAVAGQDWPR